MSGLLCFTGGIPEMLVALMLLQDIDSILPQRGGVCPGDNPAGVYAGQPRYLEVSSESGPPYQILSKAPAISRAEVSLPVSNASLKG